MENIVKRTKYKKHNEDDILAALTEAENKNFSVRKIAQRYNIPKTTLQNRLKNNNLKEKGQPRTKNELSIAAKDILSLRTDSSVGFKKILPSEQWVKDFMKRHSKISARIPESLTKASANVTATEVKSHYDYFYEFLIKNGYQDLLSKPERWFNLDEKSYVLNPLPKKVLAPKGVKNVYRVDHKNSKESLTVTHCFCADGTYLPSQIIFKKVFSRLGDVATTCGSEGAFFLFAQTENGWQTKDVFFEYIKKLNDLIKSPRPIIITYDNHSSHIDIKIFRWCAQNGIIIWTLPANTTHVTQMADVSMYRPVNSEWNKSVQEWKFKNNKQNLDECDFVTILNSVEKKVFEPQKIKNGFRSVGVFPLNFNNLHVDRFLGSSKSAEIEIADNSSNETTYEEYLENEEEYIVEALDPDFIQEFEENYTNNKVDIENIKSLSTVLPRPQNYIKEGKRKYKILNSGVMTSDEILEQCSKIEEEKLKKNREMEEKKKLREEKRILKEEQALIKANKKRIKTETFEDVIFNEGASKPKRGRPKKQNN
ncbi:hypothetical protein PVAND_004724 [Polypedilum vanderplanki]|uniref:HTH psq-type domain-containing protein n=1 Tax=Polypedilum vanderplanki TaxID=319348 RepID=A0A9J6BZY4_POLVA|nr:hypothetical protein PVAND_004724 [Polypedilum vanderplanki]